MGPQGRKEFTQTETIQGKLDGLVLVIEGQGKSKEDGTTVHTALAFVSYDEQAKTFRWRALPPKGDRPTPWRRSAPTRWSGDWRFPSVGGCDTPSS